MQLILVVWFTFISWQRFSEALSSVCMVGLRALHTVAIASSIMHLTTIGCSSWMQKLRLAIVWTLLFRGLVINPSTCRHTRYVCEPNMSPSAREAFIAECHRQSVTLPWWTQLSAGDMCGRFLVSCAWTLESSLRTLAFSVVIRRRMARKAWNLYGNSSKWDCLSGCCCCFCFKVRSDEFVCLRSIVSFAHLARATSSACALVYAAKCAA